MHSIEDHIADHEENGAKQANLGFHKMPPGYALMINSDGSHYYWLRHDGAESAIHWNQWAVYLGAKEDSQWRALQVG